MRGPEHRRRAQSLRCAHTGKKEKWHCYTRTCPASFCRRQLVQSRANRGRTRQLKTDSTTTTTTNEKDEDRKSNQKCLIVQNVNEGQKKT
eukprot:5072729-Pleurochrysis_carterae.AAC.1